jgi:hypothetical protein
MRVCAEIFAAVLLSSPAASAAGLSSATLNAWNGFVKMAESRLPNGAEPGLRERVRAGEIVAAPVSGKALSVPHGAIHDWAGAVFIPKVSLADVFAVVRNYDYYSDYYGPAIRDSKLLSRGEGVAHFRARYVEKALFITVAIDVEYEVRHCRLSDTRWYSAANSGSIRQIQRYGSPGERELPADDPGAYVWRSASFLRFDASDGGVYVEQENAVLSRAIPGALRWIAEPFVERLSRGLITAWLRRTREAAIMVARKGGAQGVDRSFDPGCSVASD